MIAFDLFLTFPAGVMISGYSSVAEGLHGETARDAGGAPIIPTTAIRGALREALESLLRGVDQRACAGGTGVDPAEPAEAEPAPRPCTLGDGGTRCIPCRLFGTQRAAIDAEAGERTFSALVLGNAELQGDQGGWVHRPGVALDRHFRSAANNLLFLQRTAGGRGRVFRAQGRLIDPSLRPYLEAAIRATTHLGGGKSRGLARVDMEPRFMPSAPAAGDTPPGPDAEARTMPARGDVRLRLTLLSPASLGAPVADDNVHDTRREIPGSSLRGAVGFALAEALDDPSDAAFQRLVAENGAHFGFLYPIDDEQGGLSAPLPITAVACKLRGREEHGVADTLLDQIAVMAARTVEEAAAVAATSIHRCTTGGCNSPLRSVRGGRRSWSAIPVRAVTRASTDRRFRSAKNEALFTQVLVEAGTRFEGTIRAIPDDDDVRARLAQALTAPLSVGRGRAMGWGRVSVEVLDPPPSAPLGERRDAFERALAERFAEVAGQPCATGFGAHLAGRLVPLTLLSPLAPAEEDDDGSADILRATGAAGCFLRARRFVREGGWDQRAGRMEALLATAAGGVFVLIFATATAALRAMDALEAMEREGVGQRRHQGYGEILCFDPFITQRRFSQ